MPETASNLRILSLILRPCSCPCFFLLTAFSPSVLGRPPPFSLALSPSSQGPLLTSLLPCSTVNMGPWSGQGVCGLETSKQITCRAPELGHVLEETCPFGSGLETQLGCGLGFTGPPETWGLQWGLGETGAQSALSDPRLLPISPPSPLCCPEFLSLFLPTSQGAPRWRGRFTVEPKGK